MANTVEEESLVEGEHTLLSHGVRRILAENPIAVPSLIAGASEKASWDS